MRIRAVYERDVHDIGDIQVVEILPCPNEEPMILYPPLTAAY